MYNNGRVHPQDPDRVARAWQLQKRGIAATNAGRPGDGAGYLRAGLSSIGWVDGSPLRDTDPEVRNVAARLLISLAYAEAELGRVPNGLRLLDDADQYLAPENRGYAALQRGLVLWVSGSNLAALSCFDRAETMLSDPLIPNAMGQLLLNRGAVLSQLGRYRQARRDLDRCAALAEQHGFTTLMAKARHSQGAIELGLGDVPSALRLYTEAERLYERSAPAMVPTLKVSQASALRNAGLRHEAAARLDAAIQELSEADRQRSLLTSEVHRARVALDLGDHRKAVAMAAQAMHRAERLDSPALSDWAEQVRREAEFRMGAIFRRFAVETGELAARHRALEQFDIAELTELLMARSLVRIGDLDEARPILERRARTASVYRQTADLTRQLGRAELAWARGDRSRAMAALRTGLEGLHQHRKTFGSLELQTGVASLGIELADMGLGLALDTGRPATVFAWAERSRAQAFRLPSVIPPEDPDAADLLAQVRRLHEEIRDAERQGEQVRRQRARLRETQRRLRERAWQLAGPVDSVPEVGHRAVHQDLAAADAVMISFVQHNTVLYALVLRGGRTRLYRSADITEVEESVRRLLADLNAFTGRKLPDRMSAVVRTSIANHSARLDDLLFTDLRRILGDDDLVIVPTGLLASVPWGMLPSLRGRPVTVAPSAATWWAARRRPVGGPGRPLLASGPNLVHAESEVDNIARLYPNAVSLRGADATPARILSDLDGAPIAHLAAHGNHEPDNVLFSQLVFEDGPLMAHDIARLGTPPTQVTLSACDVGQSTVGIGDETLGFTAALLYAGTRTVVSSVAKVEHKAAADIMVAYHRGLVEGLPPAHALARAAADHPLSPFVCYGAG